MPKILGKTQKVISIVAGSFRKILLMDQNCGRPQICLSSLKRKKNKIWTFCQLVSVTSEAVTLKYYFVLSKNYFYQIMCNGRIIFFFHICSVIEMPLPIRYQSLFWNDFFKIAIFEFVFIKNHAVTIQHIYAQDSYLNQFYSRNLLKILVNLKKPIWLVPQLGCEYLERKRFSGTPFFVSYTKYLRQISRTSVDMYNSIHINILLEYLLAWSIHCMHGMRFCNRHYQRYFHCVSFCHLAKL